VIDSSAAVELLTNSELAVPVATVAGDAELFAPELLTLECVNALRGLERGRHLDPPEAAAAIDDLGLLPVRRIDTGPLTAAIWALRHNLTAYDASYVALARSLGCPLVTLDQRLTRVRELGIDVVVPAQP